MLQMNQSKTMNGQVVIDDQQIVHLNATVASSDGNTHVNYSVSDHVIYNENKDQCRANIMDFLKQVFALEDQMSD